MIYTIFNFLKNTLIRTIKMIYNFVLRIFKYFKSKSSESNKSKTKHAHPKPKKVIKKQSLLTLLEKNESQTPILNIMNCLSTKDLARMSMVSKAVKDISDGILQPKVNMKIMDVYCGNSCTIVKTEHSDGIVKLFRSGCTDYGELGCYRGDHKYQPYRFFYCDEYFREIRIHLRDGEKIDNVIFGYSRTIITIKNGERAVKILGCGDFGYQETNGNFHELFEVPNEGDHIENVICSQYQTIVSVKKSDESIELYSCGYHYSFRRIFNNYQIESVFSSENYTLIKSKDSNKLFDCGNGYYDQLGFNERERISNVKELPISLNDEEKINDIFCYYHHYTISITNIEGQVRLVRCDYNRILEELLGASVRKAEFKNIPVPLNPDEIIEKVMVKPHHTIISILNTQGSLKILGCGGNYSGQLGFDKRITRDFEELPIPLNDGETIENVFSDLDRTFVSVRNTDGQVRILGCGNNCYGQLGLDDNKEIKKFTQIPISLNKDDRIDNIICDEDHTIICAKDSQGNHIIYGSGKRKYLGLGFHSHLNQFLKLPIKRQILDSIDIERSYVNLRP